MLMKCTLQGDWCSDGGHLGWIKLQCSAALQSTHFITDQRDRGTLSTSII
jgi:hypothetical protein